MKQKLATISEQFTNEKYRVAVSQNAQEDLDDLTNFIAFELKSPITSLRYTNGIIAEMKKLSIHAGSISISTQRFVLQYGKSARQVSYKKHTIIYTIQGENVIIEGIVASALIPE